MLSIKHIPSEHFSEVHQPAPLRWSVLYVETDGQAIGQHGWWKCKDFLNDSVVYLATQKEFSIYGYKNKLQINKGLSYIALKNVPQFFEQNLDLLNVWLVERDFPQISVHENTDKDITVIGVPEFYWKNTFLISVITSLIRSCVYKEEVDGLKMFMNEPTLQGYFDKMDKALTLENIEKMNSLVFKNYNYDIKDLQNVDTYLIHNAGLQTWINSGAFE